ncbi:MAG: 1-acyl-sn-glycerol-3-phosphate acyltransferase [Symbiobacteriaceae bacterium]|nr:1-acyl-sn-glycerol-3-phosphate acyltransferase [Symbiobacteriaceae bacterium]
MLRSVFSLLGLLPKAWRRALVRWFLDIVWNRYTDTTVSGLANIPDGPCLFIANHLSNADAVSVYRALRPRRVHFLAGVKLKGTTMTRVVMEALDTIPIKPDSADVEALKRAVDTLKHGKSVLIFPEGTRSRTGQMQRGKRGVSLIARRSGVPIVPIALTGTEQFLPINDSNMGGEKMRHAAVTVTVGKAFHVDELSYVVRDGEDERQVIVDAMMLRLAALLPPPYRGVYNQPADVAASEQVSV